jgi:hypothetical protein
VRDEPAAGHGTAVLARDPCQLLIDGERREAFAAARLVDGVDDRALHRNNLRSVRVVASAGVGLYDRATQEAR